MNTWQKADDCMLNNPLQSKDKLGERIAQVDEREANRQIRRLKSLQVSAVRETQPSLKSIAREQ